MNELPSQPAGLITGRLPPAAVQTMTALPSELQLRNQNLVVLGGLPGGQQHQLSATAALLESGVSMPVTTNIESPNVALSCQATLCDPNDPQKQVFHGFCCYNLWGDLYFIMHEIKHTITAWWRQCLHVHFMRDQCGIVSTQCSSTGLLVLQVTQKKKGLVTLEEFLPGILITKVKAKTISMSSNYTNHSYEQSTCLFRLLFAMETTTEFCH